MSGMLRLFAGDLVPTKSTPFRIWRLTVRQLWHPVRHCRNVISAWTALKCASVDWIQLAQDRIQWRALVNTVSLKAENLLYYLSDYQLLNDCFMELETNATLKDSNSLKGWDAVPSGGNLPTFRRNLLPTSSVYNTENCGSMFLQLLVSFYNTTRHHIPADSNLHHHGRENNTEYEVHYFIWPISFASY
jgi:hypothetical protein